MDFFIRLIFTLIAFISISSPVFAKNMGDIYIRYANHISLRVFS